jgi:hypothetical protein
VVVCSCVVVDSGIEVVVVADVSCTVVVETLVLSTIVVVDSCELVDGSTVVRTGATDDPTS